MGLKPPANKVYPAEHTDADLIPVKPTPWGLTPRGMVAVVPDDHEEHSTGALPSLSPQRRAGTRATRRLPCQHPVPTCPACTPSLCIWQCNMHEVRMCLLSACVLL